jgi:hypothetical protein
MSRIAYHSFPSLISHLQFGNYHEGSVGECEEISGCVAIWYFEQGTHDNCTRDRQRDTTREVSGSVWE